MTLLLPPPTSTHPILRFEWPLHLYSPLTPFYSPCHPFVSDSIPQIYNHVIVGIIFHFVSFLKYVGCIIFSRLAPIPYKLPPNTPAMRYDTYVTHALKIFPRVLPMHWTHALKEFLVMLPTYWRYIYVCYPYFWGISTHLTRRNDRNCC